LCFNKPITSYQRQERKHFKLVRHVRTSNRGHLEACDSLPMHGTISACQLKVFLCELLVFLVMRSGTSVLLSQWCFRKHTVMLNSKVIFHLKEHFFMEYRFPLFVHARFSTVVLEDQMKFISKLVSVIC
jgi:hypothetical protein